MGRAAPRTVRGAVVHPALTVPVDAGAAYGYGIWLFPHLHRLSGLTVRLYYRASRGGEPVPATGPVLLLANHPNALLDPMCVAWAAARPVRFLAKAPLFAHPVLGGLVRASGALPVYRRQDDASLTDRNEETFRAVHSALAAGGAVALFPEGISHSQPAIAPLKTGAARIALGAASAVGRDFPIMPVGLVFRAKDRFRSEAHAVVGAPVPWSDLASRGAGDHDAVRELTERIDAAMRTVTLNLARWEDERIVRTAEEVWAAARGADPSPAARVARIATAAGVLALARASGDPRWSALARDVREHGRLLEVLHLRAQDVAHPGDASDLVRWAARRLTVVALAELVLAAIATVLFWVPYRLTGIVAGRMAGDPESVSTYRVVGGTVVFAAWIALLAAAAWRLAGWTVGTATLVLAPALAVAGLQAVERWRWTLLTARRWLTVRRGDPRIASLRARQAELAQRLDEALALAPPPTAP